MKHTILIIEDDHNIQKMLAGSFHHLPYRIELVADGKSGLQAYAAHNPDLVLLDLGLPDMSGIQVIQQIRREKQTPIVIISARLEMADKIEALDAGADDYLTKPFEVLELMARIRAALRRIESIDTEHTVFKNGNLEIDTLSQSVQVQKQALHLTPIEYKLLILLAQNVGKVLTYQTILNQVWGLYSNNIPALRVFMTTLRKKIEVFDPSQRYLKTHIGVGYQMLKIDTQTLD